jgi:hypothetical protein
MTKIILDRFPCHLVAIAAGELDDILKLRSYEPTPGAKYLEITRVILTETEIVVAKDGNSGPVIVFQEAYDQVSLSEKPTEDTRVVTSSGKMLAFKKDTGCGCGSRLRGWNPYKTLGSSRD